MDHGICTSLHRAGTDPRLSLILSPPAPDFAAPLHPSNGPSCETRVPVVIGSKVETKMTRWIVTALDPRRIDPRLATSLAAGPFRFSWPS
jgi:hypothetical protein